MKKKFNRKNQAGWRQAKQYRKKAKIKDLLIRMMTLLGLGLFLCLGSFIYSNIDKSVWDGKNQLNLVIQADKVYLYSYHPQDEIINILILPNDIYIPVIRDFGEYPIGKIILLGQQESLNGGDLLRLSVQNLLAIPVDGYIFVPGGEANISDLENGKLLKLAGYLIKNKMKTNLTLWDIYRFLKQSASLPQGAIKKTDFSTSELFSLSELPDGSKVIKPNYLKIDQLSVRLFSDPEILKEGLAISILNGSEKYGLANDIGRFIRNLGGRLINTGDTKDYKDTTVIYFKDEQIKKSYTVRKLVKTFNINSLQEKNQNEDIVIELGKNFIDLNL